MEKSVKHYCEQSLLKNSNNVNNVSETQKALMCVDLFQPSHIKVYKQCTERLREEHSINKRSTECTVAFEDKNTCKSVCLML